MVRVMVEHGKKKRVVASAFDWPGWGRSVKLGGDVLPVLEAYRPRYAKVAELAGLGREFDAAGKLEVVEELEGTGMSEFYGVSGRTAAPEYEQMSDAECTRKVALLQATWAYFDDVASRVSAELRKGPRGGGRRSRPHRASRERQRDPGGRPDGRSEVGTRRLGETRTSSAPIAMPSPTPSANRTPAVRGSILDGAVPDPALCLAYARSCLGDGGPGPLGRGLNGSLPRSGVVASATRIGPTDVDDGIA